MSEKYREKYNLEDFLESFAKPKNWFLTKEIT
jgi:hypothetical protein